MKRVSLVLTVPVLALVLAASAAGTAPTAKILHAGGPVNALAMDGGRVAYDVGNPSWPAGTGNKVVVWNVLSGTTVKVSGSRTNQADITSTGRGVTEVAIAATRVAWIINEGGNTESDDYLCVSTVTAPREYALATATRGVPESGPAVPGRWIGHVVGSSGLVVVNRWTTDSTGAIVSGGLDKIRSRSLERIATGAPALFSASADAGHVAVLRSGGTVAIFSATGRLVKTIATPGARKVALNGTYLVALTNARKLDVYDSRTGRKLHAWTARGPLGQAPQNLDVEANTAIYTAGRELHAVQLKTGKDRVLATLRSGVKFAQIEAPGVVYAGNLRIGIRTLGTLYFIPFKHVAAAIS